jgi:hypothetical protein
MEMQLPTTVFYLWGKCLPQAWPKLGRFSGRSLAVSEPFLDPNGQKLGFEGQKRLKNHRQWHTRWLQHHPRQDMAVR